jgi:soluble lytic murein transglycosylase
VASQTLNRRAMAGLFAGFVGLACGCRGGSAPEARPAAGPSLVQSAPVAPNDAMDGGSAPPEPGMPRLAAVLEDPRLSFARERVDARDDSAAAREVDLVRARVALDPRKSCEWSYLSGRLHLSAGETTEAAASFERVSSAADEGGAPCSLVAYARLRETEALVRANRYDEALVCVQRVGEDLAARDEAKLALADTLSCKGDRAGAVAIWRAFLAANPRGFRWVDATTQLATALLDGIDGPPPSVAQEVIDRMTRVLVEAPVTADKLDAAGLRSRAALALKIPLPPLTPEDRARQAQAWLDASQPKHAREAADDLLANVPKGPGPHHAAACSAAIVRAQATPRGKAEDAATAWGFAIARCDGEDALVTALYYGARASASARHDAEALSRFEKVERLFPKHRLADDARFRSALVVRDQGDEARSLTMLASVRDAYPDGDMGDEALFRVALDKLAKHDLDRARAPLDQLLATVPQPAPDRAPLSATARRAAYFRARIAELAGEAADAKSRYQTVVAGAPLDYYMLLAYARLRGIDDALARSTLEAAVASEPPGSLVGRDRPELASPAFDRFVSLLEVGEFDAARREASAAGLVGDTVDREVLWAIAWLYDRAGAPDLGHAFAHGRLGEFRAHWPAGRWKLAWEIAFPRAFDAVVVRESESTRIPSALTWAIMREESAFNPEAKSVANAIGLMQLMAGTARLVAKDAQLPFDEQALHRPDVSIALGARLLSSLRGSFPIHPAFAIAAYNGGSVAVRRWLVEHGNDDFDVFVERIPFDETRNYVKRVLASEAAYAYLYAPAALDELLAMPARLTAPATVTTP